MKYYISQTMPTYGVKLEDRFPVGRPVWAVAYRINDDTEDARLKCLPTRGEIVHTGGKYGKYQFVPYKNGTTEKRKSGEVEVRSRIYADTYEEAVEMYNELVQKRIDKLYQMIESSKSDLIR